MLPNAEESESMDQASMTYTFNLCAKAGAQMLQTSVQQQTYIDELRSQVRSLQTQVSNLTASIDEIENRIFVRLQSMQPTIYTREGIPFDDALDTLTAKLQTQSEKINNNQEHLEKIESEIQAKVDREDFVAASQEAQKTSDSFQDLSLGMQALQKELQRQRQENQDNNERVMQSLKLQIQQNALHQTIADGPQETGVSYVTHEELNAAISKLKVLGNEQAAGDSVDSSAIVEFALGGDGVTQEKVEGAFEMLKKKQADIDAQYQLQKAKLADEYGRLMKVAEANQESDDEDDLYDDDDWDYEEELDAEEEPPIIEFRSVAVDYNDGVVSEETDSRPYGECEKVRSIGLQANVDKFLKKAAASSNATDDNAADQPGAPDNEAQPSDDEDDVVVEEETDAPSRSEKSQRSERSGRKKSKKQKNGMKAIIDQMKNQKPVTVMPKGERQGRADESRITQKVLNTVMPRVENLLVDAFSGGKGGGIKLEKHEAKQLIEQLTTLDQIRTELRNQKTKVAQKADRIRVDEGFKVRMTREELYAFLAQLLPDNPYLETLMHNQKSSLPPLKPKTRPPVDQPPQPTLKKPVPKHQASGTVTLVPTKNPKMLPINQKFARGNDGKYYFRDMTNDKVAPNASGNPNIFGGAESNISAAFDFQGYMPVNTSKQSEPAPAALGGIREKTPCDTNN